MGITLWGVVIAQNLILLYLLKRSLSIFRIRFTQSEFTGLLMGLILLSGVGWESSKILADIFVCYLILSALIYLFSNVLTSVDRVLIPLIFGFSALTHYSHLAIALGISVMAIVYFLWKKQNLRLPISLFVLSIFSVGSVILSNGLSGNGYRLSKASSIFMMGKMAENGILPTYLNEYCDEEDWTLCSFRDSLPVTGWQFVWDPNSPVHRTGGWQANESEYDQLLKEMVSRPKYAGLIAYKFFENSWIQMTQWNVGDNLFRYERDSNVQRAIQRYFPLDAPRSFWSKQFLVEINFRLLSFWYMMILLGLTAFSLFVARKTHVHNTWVQVILFLLVLIFINAAVTSNFSNISSRLQARVIWMPVWFLLVGLVSYWFEPKLPKANKS